MIGEFNTASAIEEAGKEAAYNEALDAYQRAKCEMWEQRNALMAVGDLKYLMDPQSRFWHLLGLRLGSKLKVRLIEIAKRAAEKATDGIEVHEDGVSQ